MKNFFLSMNLLESLEFIENNWDACCNDQSISQALKGSTESVSNSDSFFTKEVEKMESQFLLECNQNLKIDDIYENTLSSLKLIDGCNKNLTHSLGELNSTKDYYDSASNTNVPRDVYDFFNTYLPIISKIKYFQTVENNDIIRVHNFLKKYPNLRKIYTGLIPAFEFYSQARVKSSKKFIVENIYNENFRNKCIENYDFYEQMVDFDEHIIKQLQEDCIRKIAINIIYNLRSSPFNDFNTKELRENAIKQILKLEIYTPENLPKFNDHPKPEFRIIKFIVELPDIIRHQLQNLQNVFHDEKVPFFDFLTKELYKEYKTFLQNLQINRKPYMETAMAWCLIFRVSSFHGLTVLLESPYKEAVGKMINETTRISNDRSNSFYLDYMKPTAPLFAEYRSLINKEPLDKLKTPQSQLYYVNKMISVFKEYIYPTIKRITMYHHDLLAHRNNFDKTWYDGIFKRIKEYNNLWMLRYVSELQNSPALEDFTYTYNYLDEKYFLKYLCYMNLYIGHHPDLYDHCIQSVFGSYIEDVEKKYPRFQEDDISPILNYSNKQVSADFLNQNYQTYIIEVKKFTILKLSIIQKEDEKSTIFDSILGKVKNISEIELEDKNIALKKFLYPFADHFSHPISILCKRLMRKKDIILPDESLVFDEIMNIL